MRLVDEAQTHIQRILKAGDYAVDATAGNGHDTLFLAQCVGPKGHVWALDIQAQALDATQRRLMEAQCAEQVTLCKQSHDALINTLPKFTQGKVKAIMFNLGYLPGSDKALTTQTHTTLSALKQALEFLADEGILSIMLYPGHPGGDEEAAEVFRWSQALTHDAFTINHIQTGKSSAPELILIAPKAAGGPRPEQVSDSESDARAQ